MCVGRERERQRERERECPGLVGVQGQGVSIKKGLGRLTGVP